MEADECQAAMEARVVEVMDEDCRVIDTILSLVVAFVLLIAQKQAPKWLLADVQPHLHQPGAPALAPTLGPLPASSCI